MDQFLLDQTLNFYSIYTTYVFANLTQHTTKVKNNKQRKLECKKDNGVISKKLNKNINEKTISWEPFRICTAK